MKWIICLMLFSMSIDADELNKVYYRHCVRESDINEHLPTLRKLSSECTSVVEIGVRGLVSTWAFLKGLSENSSGEKSYVGIDIVRPPENKFNLAQGLAASHGINFTFHQTNDMNFEIDSVDLLFIDSLHTYCHLTYELEKFSHHVRKYIVLHDTSRPWESKDDITYKGDYSEYPEFIDRSKRGLWAAVLDFLQKHPEWSLLERRTNKHGLTTLRRN